MPNSASGRFVSGNAADVGVIQSPISTLDFTATALKLAGGEIPAEFDGTDVLPLLSQKAKVLTRTKDLFWDWGDGIALQRDGWKIHRWGKKTALFNIREDPNEFFDLQLKEPAKFKEMESALMARYNALPPAGRSPLRGVEMMKKTFTYTQGAPSGTLPDPRYLYPYKDGKPVPYPAPLVTPK